MRQSLGNAAGSGGPALLFSQSLLEHIRADVLTDGQKELLTAALDERVQAARKAYAAYLAALIDSELFLTTEQLATITKQFEELDATKLHPLYSFQPYNYYIPYQSLATLLNAKPISDCLVKQQRGRLEDLQRAGDGGMNLTFMSNTGPLEWQRQLTEAGSTGRQMLLRAAELRIAFLERELKLPEEQLDRLRTASKGAAVQSLDDWKETAQQTIAQMEQQMAQFQGNFGFGTQALDVNSLDSNEVWTYAMSEATGSESSKLLDRGDVLHDAMAGALTALLDDELWLTAEQRASLRTMVGKSLPNKSNPAQNQEYIRELILLAYPLFRTNTDQRTAMLTDTQQAIWTKMQSYFHWQKANQYVQIQLRNGGGSFGFMLPE